MSFEASNEFLSPFGPHLYPVSFFPAGFALALHIFQSAITRMPIVPAALSLIPFFLTVFLSPPLQSLQIFSEVPVQNYKFFGPQPPCILQFSVYY